MILIYRTFYTYSWLLQHFCLIFVSPFYFKQNTTLYWLHVEKKEEMWLSPMIKDPTPAEMSKGQSENTNNATKKFDYTAVADRLGVTTAT